MSRRFPRIRSLPARRGALLLLLLAAPFARADDAPDKKPAPAEVERAHRLLDEGNSQLQARRYDQAISRIRESVEILRRETGESVETANALGSLGHALNEAARPRDAQPVNEEALRIRRRLLPGDSLDVVKSLIDLALTFSALGKPADAVPLNTEALERCRRLFPGDHPDVSTCLNNLAQNYDALGRYAESLPLKTEALAMLRRLYPGDNLNLLIALSNLGQTYFEMGRREDALQQFLDALAMCRRLIPGDHPFVAKLLNNVAATYGALGRCADALPVQVEVVAMLRRLSHGDHPDLAKALDNLAGLTSALGRQADAVPLETESLEMLRRLFPGDHPLVATSLGNLAGIEFAMGRSADALPLAIETLEMLRRLYPGDHPLVATSLADVAVIHGALGQHAEALPLEIEALEMRRRLFPGDHPSLVGALSNLGATYGWLGKREEALATLRLSAEMAERIGWPDRHVPLTLLGRIVLSGGDPKEAIGPLSEAVRSLDQRRAEARGLTAAEQAAYEAEIRHADPYPPLARAEALVGAAGEAVSVLERGRGRAMLDLLTRGQVDPLALVEEKARAVGDATRLQEVTGVRDAVGKAETAVAAAEQAVETSRQSRDRRAIQAALENAATERKALLEALGRQARLVRDTVPEASPRSVAEIQALLAPGERMVFFVVDEDACQAFLVPPAGGEVRAFYLGVGKAALKAAELEEAVSSRLAALSDANAEIDASTDLFRMLIPEALWNEVQKADVLYVVPHGRLYALPLEALVVGEKDGKPVYWLDEGPPVAYVPSGSVLGWLRERRAAQEKKPVVAKLVALGDPVFGGSGAGGGTRGGRPSWPEKGVFVTDVPDGGQAKTLGIRPGDVIVGYGSAEVTDSPSLRAALAAVPEGTKEVEVRLWHEGEVVTVKAAPGRLGVQVADDPPGVAGPKFLARNPSPAPSPPEPRRAGALVPLPGTRTEIEAISKAVATKEGAPVEVVTLLGLDATEERLYEAAEGATYLHIATHGIADETETASFSALALTKPPVPVAGNDGFLTLVDLLGRWRERLKDAHLVVLSACDTQRGRLQKDEGVVALPWGFHFAGCPTVVATLWEVSDETTPLLMADFYRRLMAQNGNGRLAALLAAKRALRASHPHPFYWAPFVLLGDPR